MLAALGHAVNRFGEERLASPTRTWHAAAAWMLTGATDDLVVLRGDRLSAATWARILDLRTSTDMRLLLVCHTGRIPAGLSGVLAGIEHRVLQNLPPALRAVPALLACRDAPVTSQAADELPALPARGVAHYRAEAYRRLDPDTFERVDTVYRHGFTQASAWLNNPAGRALPGTETEQATLFLITLVQDSPTRAHTLARVRGAQAAFLAHGYLLTVPDTDALLHRLHGPGLDTAPFTEATAGRIRAYGLLEDADRRLFERMSVFAGGADAEAVAAVLGCGVPAVLNRLQGLADQSLVSARAHQAGTRYGLLEPVRAYAAQRLRERGEEPARQAHAAWFVQLAERADEGVRGPEDRAWIARLVLELANLRVAHAHLLDADDADGALRLAATHFWCGWLMGVSETHGWAERATERFADRTGPVPAAAWATVAMGALFRGELSRAAELAARSISAVGRGCGASRFGLLVEATIPVATGDFGRAVELYDELAPVSRAAGDTFHLVVTYGAKGIALAYAGRAQEAARVADEGLQIARELGNSTLRALALYYAGEARLDSVPAEAAVLLDAALSEARQAGTRFVLGAAGLSRVSLLARHGDPEGALARCPDLLEHWQRSGTWAQQWLTVRTLVEALSAAGHATPAAVLYGAMEASPTALPLIGQDAVRLVAVLARLRDVLATRS